MLEGKLQRAEEELRAEKRAAEILVPALEAATIAEGSVCMTPREGQRDRRSDACVCFA